MALRHDEYYCIWCHEVYAPRESRATEPEYFCSPSCHVAYSKFVKDTETPENDGGEYGPN